MPKFQIGEIVMAKADDTYLKVKITGWQENNGEWYQLNLRSKEWLPAGNFIPLGEFIKSKAKKLLGCAPTNRALDMPKHYPKNHELGCAYYQVMQYYEIKINDIISKEIQGCIIDYISTLILRK